MSDAADVRVLVVAGDMAQPHPALPVVSASLRDLGERYKLLSQHQARAEIEQRGDRSEATQLVVLLPCVNNPLQLARALHEQRPHAHILIVQDAAGVEIVRNRMGLAPMLGRHWSLVSDEVPALASALQRALSAVQRRRQLRTTLSRANQQLAETKAVSNTEYQRLLASEHHLSHFLRNSRDAVIGLDAELRVLFWSQGTAQLLGIAAVRALGQPLASLGAWSSGLLAGLRDLADKQELTVEYVVDVAGAERGFEAVLTGSRDASGSGQGASIILRDVTSRRRAQDQLRNANLTLQQLVSERTQALEKSQLALIQAQKLEAIGKLTGGVAHDFNNVLQIIGSNLQLLQAELKANARPSQLVRAALGAVDRGAKLSSQLLAFGRRQPLEPVALNITSQVRRMDELLRRALGEEMEIETALSAGLWTTLVDPNQLENVILNLAINARDAMPHGGKLTIETSNSVLGDDYVQDTVDVTPGQYVMLAISDTGHGMPPDVLARAFEPFFTTKPVGQGTGLGLSMAYGFAKQSGGHIRIYSEVGSGTAIKLYLPRSFEKVVEPIPSPSAPAVGGTETVLVVEDDLAVQAAVVQTLQDLGYSVLRANEAQSAMAILQSGAHVDLLFTDVVMPGPLRSTELARQARNLLPDLAVLFTSGYTQNAIVHGGRLDAGVELLSKPYRQEDLARKMRQLLSARARAPADAGGTKRLRILVVDDEEDLRDTSKHLLELLDCDVTCAASAEQAASLLAAQPFDVLLTDYSLPGENGLAFAARVRSVQPSMAVVVSSGYDMPAAEPLKRSWVLPKPYSIEEVEKLLHEIRQSIAE